MLFDKKVINHNESKLIFASAASCQMSIVICFSFCVIHAMSRDSVLRYLILGWEQREEKYKCYVTYITLLLIR